MDISVIDGTFTVVDPLNIYYFLDIDALGIETTLNRDGINGNLDSISSFPYEYDLLSAFSAWESVAQIDFKAYVEGYTINNGIILSLAELYSTGQNTVTDGITISREDGSSSQIYLNQIYNDYSVGTEEYLSLMHEIGHVLGLKDTGISGFDSNYNTDMTIMSYNVTDKMPVSLSYYDVLAVQEKYGANTGYNVGDNIYSYDGGDSYSVTIWDGNGTDTIVANTDVGVTINLNEGFDKVTTIGNTVIRIIEDAGIENATGGSGDDSIIGNSLDNILSGGLGEDTYYYTGGNDTIIDAPGEYDDYLEEAIGNNLVFGSGINLRDMVFSRDENETLSIDVNGLGSVIITDQFTGEPVITSIEIAGERYSVARARYYGGQMDGEEYYDISDILIGVDSLEENQEDYLYGYDGDDILIGGKGNDTLAGCWRK